MKKYTDIELEMMKEAMKKEMPAMAIFIPEVAKVAIGFYEEFKNSDKVNKNDVVAFAAKMTAAVFRMDNSSPDERQ